MISHKHSPFNDAEAKVQDRLGLAAQMASQYSGYIRNDLPYSFTQFLHSLPFVVGGATDTNDNIWAFPIFGLDGFVDAITDRKLAIDAASPIADALNLNTDNDAKFGLVGIDLSTRRRLRINGTINRIDSGFEIDVQQSYGNCPQYIHKRTLVTDTDRIFTNAPLQLQPASGLADENAEAIRRADTFFIASRTRVFIQDPRSGIDASHRGGMPGFVIVNNNNLIFPDFSGNKFFNTIGNIEDDGRVGLLFPDFTSGDCTMVSGRAQVIWDDQAAKLYPGAERFIRVAVEQSVCASAYLPFHTDKVSQSPSFSGREAWQFDSQK